MKSIIQLVATRLVPAFLTAAGVVLVTAGILSYADPATAGVVPASSLEAVVETLSPSDEPSGEVSPSPEPSGSPDPSATPEGTAPASVVPDPTKKPGRAVATRVVIPALNIDLPVVANPKGLPWCNVAMYLQTAASASKDAFGQPGEGRATYLFGHARDGMFGPIYDLAIVKKKPGKMLGMVVQVYASDNRLYLYEIREYRLHVPQNDFKALEDATNASQEELWLQTSEGYCRGGRNADDECPGQTLLETQLIASPLSVSDASAKESVPKAKPVKCG